MTDIIRYKDDYDIQVTGLSTEDKEAITFFFQECATDIQVKMKSITSELNIARAWNKMKEKYPQNSNGHRELVRWMEDTLGWNKDYRAVVRQALEGADKFVANTPGMEKCLVYFTSMAQLRALRNIPDERKYELYQQVMKFKKAPSARVIAELNPYNKVPELPEVKRERQKQLAEQRRREEEFEPHSSNHTPIQSNPTHQQSPATADTEILDVQVTTIGSHVVQNERVSDDIPAPSTVEPNVSTEKSLAKRVFELSCLVDELRKEKPHLDEDCKVALRQLAFSVDLLVTGKILR